MSLVTVQVLPLLKHSKHDVKENSSSHGYPSRFLQIGREDKKIFKYGRIVFQSFDGMKRDEFKAPFSPRVSLARHNYADECESAINDQINVEYSASYLYHSMFAYFDRDNVSLKGLAKFFKATSEQEREHAEKLMIYQNMRGGKVVLQSILMPQPEFDHEERGDALFAMEFALSLEKLVNDKLLSLHHVADQNNDHQLQEFIESVFLNQQVELIKKMADYVAQLRRMGKGHGFWHFDQMLFHKGEGV